MIIIIIYIDALPHLQECLTNSDYPFVDTVNFDEFIDNMDYSIVTRFDIKLEDELIASDKRRLQYLHRIKEVPSILLILLLLILITLLNRPILQLKCWLMLLVAILMLRIP